MPQRHANLSESDRATYEWQLWTPDFGEPGQLALKNASVLVTRVGGVGGAVAYYLAAAGIGRIVLAHAGNVRQNDLNRQILMTHDWIGKPRVESAARRLRELNPDLEVETLPENITESNAQSLVAKANIIVDCAPLFSERFLLNREAVRHNKPMVDCAMYEMEARLTTIIPGKTPCLACLHPGDPPAWNRQFPVFGAVAGVVGALAATEVIKVLSGIGVPLLGSLLHCDLREMQFQTFPIQRNPNCPICGTLEGA